MNNSLMKVFVFPFQNLTGPARALQIFRFVMTMLSLIFVLIAILGPLFSIKFYVSRINCSHLDVSNGIYESLRNSVSESNSAVDLQLNGQLPVDSSLTDSEIMILTSYAERLVADSPQYYLVSLWESCTGNYNVTATNGAYGNPRYTQHDDVLTCKKGSNSLTKIFDYRDSLADYGMQVVLAYAFQGSYDTPTYGQEAHVRSKSSFLVPITMIINLILTLAMILLQYVLYSNRKTAKDLSTLPTFLLHLAASLSVCCFTSIVTGAAFITALIIKTKSEVASSLGSFGIDVMLGSLWFTVLWIGVSCSAMLMFSWIIPTWCSNPEEPDEYFESHAYQRPGNYRPKTKSSFPRDLKRDKEGTKVSERESSSSHSSIESGNKPQDRLLYASSDDEVDPHLDSDPYGDDETDSDPDDEFNSYGTDRPFFNYEDKQKSKLTKLGKSLSRNSSVRQLNRKFSKKSNGSLSSSKLHSLKEHEMTSQQALSVVQEHNAHYSPLPHHYRVDTFDGFSQPSSSSSQKPIRNPFIDHDSSEEVIELNNLTRQ